ncbi:MAG: MFS transporter, partial [Tumebacillaceae bacterium]
MMSVDKRNFFWMITGRSLSRFGDTFTFLALTLMIYDRTESVMNVGTFLITTSLPAILLGPFIGVWVDRLNKRRVALFGELLRAALIFTIPFLPNVLFIYVLTFLSSTIGFVSKNAQTSLIPELFPREQLMSYNAKIASTVEIMGVVGPVLAGMLIGFWDYTPAFLLDGTTFLYSAFSLTMLNMANVVAKKSAEAAERTSFFAEMAAGAKHLIGMPRVMNALAIMFTTMIVSGVFNVLL